MTSIMEPKGTLEPGLASILNGVDLSKLIPLFEKYSVTLEMFFALTVEDLLIIGVESLSDRELILSIRNKLRRNNQVEEDLTFRTEEVLEMVKNLQSQVHAIDVAACFIFSKFKNESVLDFLIDDDKPITSAIELFCNRVEKQSNELISQIDDILENLESNREQKKDSTRKSVYGFTCTTAVILISVLAFLKYKNN